MTVEAIVKAIRELPDRDIARVQGEVWDDEPLSEAEETMKRESLAAYSAREYEVRMRIVLKGYDVAVPLPADCAIRNL